MQGRKRGQMALLRHLAPVAIPPTIASRYLTLSGAFTLAAYRTSTFGCTRFVPSSTLSIRCLERREGRPTRLPLDGADGYGTEVSSIQPQAWLALMGHFSCLPAECATGPNILGCGTWEMALRFALPRLDAYSGLTASTGSVTTPVGELFMTCNSPDFPTPRSWKLPSGFSRFTISMQQIGKGKRHLHGQFSFLGNYGEST